MSVSLAGYTTTRLVRTSTRGAVYEVERKRDGKRILAKVFDLLRPGDEARVEHELRLLQELDLEGVVRPLGLERAGRQVVLLLDYVEGQNLAQRAGRAAMSVGAFLPRALEIVEILGRIHARRIIHRDIKPSNLLIEAGTERIVFADFGISVLLEDERRQPHAPEMLEGTLPYISPEQTGRTKGEIDFRSDLYSLGVTFYELLTGRRPFEGRVPLELIHAHLAQRPRSPDELVETIPRTLAAIVMKLLEKAPERRYQSAEGLRADLQRLADARATGLADPVFELGTEDHPTRLQLPHQLYGREHEQDQLAAELRRVIEHRSCRLVLLSGPGGSGKSSLIRGYEAPLSAAGGMLGVGKFERPSQENRSEQPYRGFAEALAEIVRQLLTLPEDELGVWRVRLREALGPIAAVVGALVPELALVIGAMTPVPSVELGEARNRLRLALARFVSALAEDGPLVIVLDDLQWADAGSVELLEVLLDEPGSPVLFAGSLRTDELASDHPVHALRAKLGARAKAGDPVSLELELGPLSAGALEHMLADTLGRAHDDEALVALAELVGRKTANNPMFVRQYLVHLEELGLLETGTSGWTWTLDEVAGAAIPEDLLGVMQAKLARLANATRELLELAACIGSHFELELLDGVSEASSEAIVAMLWELEALGLVASSGGLHRFAHDRIQQAARAGIDPGRRQALHWALGQAMLTRAKATTGGGAGAEGELRDERLFAIVDQLDQGYASVDDLEDGAREQLAELNLEAGRQALDSAAWRSALGYFEVAVAAFGERRDEDAFEAHFGHAQGLALADDKAAADDAFKALIAWRLSDTQFARVAARRVRILQLRDHIGEALDYGRAGLERLGLSLPAKPSVAKMLLAAFGAWARVKKADLATFVAMPECSDERQNARLHLLAALMSPAFTVEPQLFVYLVSVHARLVMTQGWHVSAVETIAQLAFTMSGLGQTERALELCDTLIELCERRETTAISPTTVRNIKLMFIAPAARPFADSAAPVEDTVTDSLELGDRLGAGYLAALGLFIHLEAGTHLAEVRALDGRFREVLPDFGSREMWVVADMGARLRETIAAELDAEAPGFALIDDYSEWELSPVTRYAVSFAAVWGQLLFGEHEVARELLAPLRDDYEEVLFGMWVVPRVAMGEAILSGEEARQARGPERRRALRRVRKSLGVLRKWADKCPANYEAMRELAAGELAWARGRHRDAGDCFERARSVALDNGRVYVEVFANLRQAALADELGWEPAAAGARQAAHATLSRWGAWALVRRLERDHPELALAGVLGRMRGSGSSTSTSTLVPDGLDSSTRMGTLDLSSKSSGSHAAVTSLDLQSVLRTMQALAEGLELEEVIGRVLASAIENVGAERGALLLERGRVVELVAEGDTTSTKVMLDRAVALRDAGDRVPTSLVNLVLRTGQAFVVDDARLDPRFSADPYVQRSEVCSLLCVPIVKQDERIGALVVENRLNAGNFTEARIETLRILLSQGASALDNARLYAKLQRSEAQWRLLVEGVPDIITVLDAEGRVEFINHLGSHEGKIDHVSMAGDTYMDPASSARWRQALAEVVASGERRELEACVVPPNAARCFYTVRIMPLELGGGRGGRYLSISTDITEAKGLEAQLRQQQRLESVGTLASGVAHEINNPIQGVLSYAEMLADAPDDPDAVREFALEITQATDRVIGIIRNLLAFSRQELGAELESCSVGALIETTLSLIRAVLRKDQIKLDVDIAPDLPQVRCRMQQIQQIIMNLVTNARDALNERYPKHHEAKRIEIRARLIEREGQGWVQLSVEDRAGGIPEHVRTQIFDPFFTTKGREQGTGLGLAVSHGIATEHGGELVVDTEVGVGSTFHLRLPAAQDRLSPARSP